MTEIPRQLQKKEYRFWWSKMTETKLSQKYSWEEICQEAERLEVPPISLMFYRSLGRLPTDDELRAYIDLVVLPDTAYKIVNGKIQVDRETTQEIHSLQKQKLIKLIKKNEKIKI